MTTRHSPSIASDLAALWSFLRRAAVVKSLFALFVLLGTPYIFPILSPDQMQALSRYYAVFPFLLLVILALAKDLGRIESTGERQFWKHVTAAFVCFFLYCVLYAAFLRVDPQWLMAFTETTGAAPADPARIWPNSSPWLSKLGELSNC